MVGSGSCHQMSKMSLCWKGCSPHWEPGVLFAPADRVSRVSGTPLGVMVTFSDVGRSVGRRCRRRVLCRVRIVVVREAVELLNNLTTAFAARGEPPPSPHTHAHGTRRPPWVQATTNTRAGGD